LSETGFTSREIESLEIAELVQYMQGWIQKNPPTKGVERPLD